MNSLPSTFFIIRQLVIILLTNGYPGSKWLSNKQKNACEKLGKALNIFFTVGKIRFHLDGSFTMKELHIRKKHKLSFTATGIHGKINLRTLLRKELLLSSLSAATIQLNILSASHPAPENTVPVKQPAFPLQPIHYKGVFRLLSRLKKHIPLHTDIAAVTMTIGRHTFSIKKLAIEKREGNLHFSANETQSPGMLLLSSNSLLSITNITDRALSLSLLVEQGTISSHVLSSKEIRAEHLSLHMDCHLSGDAFTLAETAIARYNQLRFSLYGTHDFSHNHFKAGIRLEEISIADFLRAFPDFSYRKIYGLSFTGTVASVNAVFTCNTNNLWEHTFELELQNNQLQLAECPANWHNLNEKPVNTSHHYLDIGQIQPLLLATILSSEDTMFFKHRGLDPMAIGYSIVQNIINREFRRGASTITMQLVRNLFLNHEKTLYRKIEEIFIALLLEHFFHIPKMKILEYYLNIIEMGPNVYSLANASWFYFSKPANDLTLTECLVLSYIIPRPKFFLDAFLQESEQLKRNLRTHIKRFGRLLFLQGIITQEQQDGLNMRITIQGKTLSLLQTAGA
ncbi:biosynthetic peptidoglycan transglycosylase [Chitinophaga sancti]|uniref:biosynthetic peptidoglycan transglycosylase n=1 Tax=Chitinophaga sancti TaxID=1004 RepID=UPI003F7A5FF0